MPHHLFAIIMTSFNLQSEKAKFHQYVNQLRPVDEEWQTRKLRYLFARFTMLWHSAVQLGFTEGYLNELRVIFKSLLPYPIQVEITSGSDVDENPEDMAYFLNEFDASLRKREVVECEMIMNSVIRRNYSFSELGAPLRCVFCDSQMHSNSRCPSTFWMRIRVIHEKNLCRICLKPGHYARDCLLFGIKCRTCGRDHFTYMCRRNFSFSPNPTQTEQMHF